MEKLHFNHCTRRSTVFTTGSHQTKTNCLNSVSYASSLQSNKECRTLPDYCLDGFCCLAHTTDEQQWGSGPPLSVIVTVYGEMSTPWNCATRHICQLLNPVCPGEYFYCHTRINRVWLQATLLVRPIHLWLFPLIEERHVAYWGSLAQTAWKLRTQCFSSNNTLCARRKLVW